MYGLVNKAIEELICRQHGAAAWRRIVERAGLDDTGFVSMDDYPDSVTYGLVQSASAELDVPGADLLEAFGRHWISYTGREGYGELLDASGRSFDEFLDQLDALHSRVGLTLPNLRPPSFVVERGEPGAWRLRYYSERVGLAPMVVGLVRGLADRFGMEVDVMLEAPRSAESDCDVFAIRLAEA
ncbi:MAG: heme NO-binding domain-containing protein [Planctomycetota bacterium]